MKAALRYLWSTYISTSLGSLGVIALTVLVGSQLLKLGFFVTYYYMLPMMMIIFLIIFSFNVTTIYRNMALSMNCLRRHFFWACQFAFLATGLGSFAIVYAAGALPKLLGLGYYAFENAAFTFQGRPAFMQPVQILSLFAAALMLQPIGAALGGLYGKSKVWSMICLILISLLGVVATSLLMFTNDGTLVIPPVVPAAFLAALAAVCAVCQVYFWRSNAKTVVQ